MPKGTGGIAAATLVLLLAGCTAAPPPPGPSTPAPTVAHEAPAETTPPPLVAEEPTESGPDEAAFIARFRELQAGIKTQIPNATDEQLLQVGYEVCDVAPDGTDTDGLSLIDGETANEGGIYVDTRSIVIAARLHLCSD